MTLKKPLMFGVVIFGLLLLIVGAGFYLLKTVDINTAKGVAEIVNPKSYMENGLFSQAHYMKYAVVPSRYTEADTVYRLTVGNGSVEREDKFYWTQLELDIQKPKLIKHGITKDEYIAIAQKPPNYTPYCAFSTVHYSICMFSFSLPNLHLRPIDNHTHG